MSSVVKLPQQSNADDTVLLADILTNMFLLINTKCPVAVAVSLLRLSHGKSIAFSEVLGQACSRMRRENGLHIYTLGGAYFEHGRGEGT